MPWFLHKVDLDSVRALVAKPVVDNPMSDLLVNIAGIVLLGPRRTSADGFDLQFVTNVMTRNN